MPWEENRARNALYQKTAIMFLPTLFIVDQEGSKAITRFGASVVQNTPQNALIAWRKGASGYFPEWFERRRVISFNIFGFLIWVITIALILHYGFGYTVKTFLDAYVRTKK